LNKNSLLVFVTAVSLVLSACASATATTAAPAATTAPADIATGTAALTPVQLKLGVLNFMSNSPLFIAQDDGYFAEQGLEVEFVDFGTSDRDMIPALLQGQLDVGLTTVNVAVLSGIAQGSNAKFVADKGFLNPEAACASDGWVARNALLEAGALDDLAALKGKKVVFSPANMIEFAADTLLESAGLSQEDVEILDMRDQATRVEALGSGALDLTSTSEPWITRARNAGAGDLWLPLSDVIPDYSIGTVIYGPSMLGRAPEVGVRFMRAYLNAIQQYNQGATDRNVEIIADHTQLDPEELKKICWPSYQPDGKINTQGLTAFEQWARAKGYTESELTLEQIWDPQFVEQAYADLNP